MPALHFKHIEDSLLQKEVPLKAFQEFLAFKLSFEKITHTLQQKKVNLLSYLEYLDENLQETSPPSQTSLDLSENTKSHESPESEESPKSLESQKLPPYRLMPTPATAKKAQVELLFSPLSQLGFRLLHDHKITLEALNKALQNLPEEQQNSRTLLQLLIRERKITTEAFLHYDQTPSEPTPSSLYNIRASKHRIEFYIAPHASHQKIGNYYLLGELGRGGMGIVYRSYHAHLNQISALKMILVEKQPSERQLSRFYREIQVVAKLKHPGIIEIYDSGMAQNSPYYVMEYVEGKPLSHLIREGLPLRQGIQILQKVLLALHYVHEQGILHRDLKPDNIFVTSLYEPKIADFGLAKEFQKEVSPQLTNEGALMGTPVYMSPEQASGKNQEMDPRSEVFSMGTCFYELLTRRVPFYSENLPPLLRKIVKEDPPPPSSLNPHLHKSLDLITLKALEKDPNLRYPSAKAFAEDLENFLTGNPISVSFSLKLHLKKWCKTHRFLLLFVSSISLLLLSLTLFFFYLTQEQKREHFTQPFHTAKLLFQQQKDTPSFLPQETLDHLLKALLALNSALSFQPQNLEAQKLKENLCENLLRFSINHQNYALAHYTSTQFPPNPRLSSQDLQNWIHQQQNKKLQQNQKNFNQWIEKLKKQPLSKSEQRDALFQISQMTEDPIFQQILSYVQEGNQAFLQKKPLSENQKQLYFLMLNCLGKLENPSPAKPLWETFLQLYQENTPSPSTQRDQPTLEYMALLTKTLTTFHFQPLLNEFTSIRFKMGRNDVFWNLTLPTYKKALSLKENLLTPLKTAADYNTIGLEKKNLKEYELAIDYFNSALELNPKLVEVYINRGNCKMLLKRHEEALINFNKASQIDPNNFEAYVARGGLYHQIKNYPLALQEYQKAIQLNPKFFEVYTNLAYLQQELQNFQEALISINKAIELVPNSSKHYLLRGIIHRKTKNYAEARTDLEKAIKLDIQDPEVFYNLALILQEENQYEEAIKNFNLAIGLKPDFAEAYTSRGHSKFKKGDLEGSLQDYDEAIRLHPNPVVYYNQGNTLTALKKYQEAIGAYDSALKLNPEYPNPYNNRGNAYFNLGEYFKAIEDYKKAVAYNPNLFLTYYNLGICSQKLNQKEEALDFFSKGLQLKYHSEIGEIFISLVLERIRKASQAKEYFKVKEDLLLLQKTLPQKHPQQEQIRQKIKQLEKR